VWPEKRWADDGGIVVSSISDHGNI
jgi:hypothetical protein